MLVLTWKKIMSVYVTTVHASSQRVYKNPSVEEHGPRRVLWKTSKIRIRTRVKIGVEMAWWILQPVRTNIENPSILHTHRTRTAFTWVFCSETFRQYRSVKSDGYVWQNNNICAQVMVAAGADHRSQTLRGRRRRRPAAAGCRCRSFSNESCQDLRLVKIHPWCRMFFLLFPRSYDKNRQE